MNKIKAFEFSFKVLIVLLKMYFISLENNFFLLLCIFIMDVQYLKIPDRKFHFKIYGNFAENVWKFFYCILPFCTPQIYF